MRQEAKLYVIAFDASNQCGLCVSGEFEILASSLGYAKSLAAEYLDKMGATTIDMHRWRLWEEPGMWRHPETGTVISSPRTELERAEAAFRCAEYYRKQALERESDEC